MTPNTTDITRVSALLTAMAAGDSAKMGNLTVTRMAADPATYTPEAWRGCHGAEWLHADEAASDLIEFHGS